MPKFVFCANCGLRLSLTRKALPKFGKIIDLVDYHECLDEPVELDLTPIDMVTPAMEEDKGHDQFVQKLNELSPPSKPTHFEAETVELSDKRPADQVKSDAKSSAPVTLLDSMKSVSNSTPAHDLDTEPKNGD